MSISINVNKCQVEKHHFNGYDCHMVVKMVWINRQKCIENSSTIIEMGSRYSTSWL
jgi:hypothetical protein